jgi:6-phosphogluconate dehydrogenase
MDIGMVGLGRMGSGVASRLIAKGFTVGGYDLDAHNSAKAVELGIKVQSSLELLAEKTSIIWLMVPAGQAVDAVLSKIVSKLPVDSIIVDGGNSFFGDAQKRAVLAVQHGHAFVDCGTSGGVHGAANGFCLMVGASKKTFSRLEPLLQAVAAPGGYAHVGPVGAGHLVKMVHNGIEYGLMQAYAEGLELLHTASVDGQSLDLEAITTLWQSGSVIRSWLLELVHAIFEQHGQSLNEVSGKVASSGMGQWTVALAHTLNCPIGVIEKALAIRNESLITGGTYGTKLVALMRNQFGGHAVFKQKE